ncbi:MAG: hypothetical protein F4059_00700 [Gemmatimonadetes bacterium]|nr:hypothetical protein [Gemmatimonadota bacterium]
MYRLCAILAAALCLVACSRHQALVALRLASFALLALALVACDRDTPTKPIASAPAGKMVATVDAPAEPTNLRVEAITDTSARVAWDAVEGATDYDVNYRTLSGRWTNEPHKGTRLYNTIYDLEPNTEYRWAVRAENSDGPSDWVFAENFTTLGTTESSVTSANLELGGSVEGDREALEALHHSANWRENRRHSTCDGDAPCKRGPLRNWLSRRRLAKWDCVEVNGEGRVVALELPCKGGYEAEWYGTIPPEIGQLTHLERLRINGRIYGPLPPEIGQLHNLRELDFTNHRLGYDRDRAIVYEFANPGWREINPHYGQPIYSLPPELGNLINLEVLKLNNNGFRQLPSELGNLHNLRVLELSGNEVSELPSTLGNLTNLEVLTLSSTGPIPPELGNLRRLKVLRASGVEGPLPPELGRLTQLDTLWLHKVRSGSIPPEFGRMTSLVYLYIRGVAETHLEEGDPRFGGPIPPELGNLINLEFLALSNGDWEGQLPASLGQLTELKYLGIYGGGFLSGTLPPEWGNMKALELLALPNQEIEGSLPKEWAFMQSLQFLDLQDNFLEGSLPDIWGQMKNLRQFDLSLNFINSPLPAGWSQMESLEKLTIVESGLTGSLPSQWKNLGNLEELNLNHNDLTGPIPSSWGAMRSLKRLRLEDNQLSGRLPDLRDLSSLSAIWLGGNNFEPDVPSEGCFSHDWYPWQLKVRTGTYRGQPEYRIHVHGINLCAGDPPPESGPDHLLGG